MIRGKEQQPFRNAGGGEIERTRSLNFSFSSPVSKPKARTAGRPSPSTSWA